MSNAPVPSLLSEDQGNTEQYLKYEEEIFGLKNKILNLQSKLEGSEEARRFLDSQIQQAENLTEKQGLDRQQMLEKELGRSQSILMRLLEAYLVVKTEATVSSDKLKTLHTIITKTNADLAEVIEKRKRCRGRKCGCQKQIEEVWALMKSLEEPASSTESSGVAPSQPLPQLQEGDDSVDKFLCNLWGSPWTSNTDTTLKRIYTELCMGIYPSRERKSEPPNSEVGEKEEPKEKDEASAIPPIISLAASVDYDMDIAIERDVTHLRENLMKVKEHTYKTIKY